jgi:Asp-tRNA(Asn)/Glu-tRNA(Gln) amidotransferase A subunit family amidase
MLSALDLARRVEAGELTPAAVVDLCAQAIAAREAEIGAFQVLDIERARRTALASADLLRAGARRGRCGGRKAHLDNPHIQTQFGSSI